MEELRRQKLEFDTKVYEIRMKELAGAERAQRELIKIPEAPRALPVTMNEVAWKAASQIFRSYVRWYALAVLLHCKSALKTQNLFTSWETMYNQRFKAFTSLGRVLQLPYSEYVKVMSGICGGNKATYLENLVTSYQNVKVINDARKTGQLITVTASPLLKVLEEEQWIALMKSSVSNSLQVSKLLKLNVSEGVEWKVNKASSVRYPVFSFE